LIISHTPGKTPEALTSTTTHFTLLYAGQLGELVPEKTLTPYLYRYCWIYL